jgi:outer membrane protein
MKMRITLLALSFSLIASYTTLAQNEEAATTKTEKIGHVNADALLQMMPETKEAQKQLETYGRQLEKDLGDMESELQTKISEFRTNEAMMTKLAKESKTQELQQLQQRIQEYGQGAQQDLQEKQVELLTPVIEKATKAVKEVARENGFTYIIDSSPSKGVVIFAENGVDIMPMVKKKLGLTGTPTPTTGK